MRSRRTANRLISSSARISIARASCAVGPFGAGGVFMFALVARHAGKLGKSENKKSVAKRDANQTAELVPGVGFEPTHLSISVFETDASAIPPPGHSLRLYRTTARASRGVFASITGGLFPIEKLLAVRQHPSPTNSLTFCHLATVSRRLLPSVPFGGKLHIGNIHFTKGR